MKERTDFVDCKAIEKALEMYLPEVVKVLKVWEGTMRNDNTYKVYVKVTQVDDSKESFFTEVVLGDMKAVIGELLDVEIIDMTTLEFGFALPLTSRYYLHK